MLSNDTTSAVDRHVTAKTYRPRFLARCRPTNQRRSGTRCRPPAVRTSYLIIFVQTWTLICCSSHCEHNNTLLLRLMLWIRRYTAVLYLAQHSAVRIFSFCVKDSCFFRTIDIVECKFAFYVYRFISQSLWPVSVGTVLRQQ